MAYILDAIVVGIFVLAVYLGYKRGFIKAISKLAAFVIAAVVAYLFCGSLAGTVFERAIAPAVEKSITPYLESADTDVTATIEAVKAKLPAFARERLEDKSGNAGSSLSALKGESKTPAQMAEEFTRGPVRTAVLPGLKMLCAIMLFLVAMILALIALRAVNKVFQLPVLHTLNGTLGLVAGVANGLVLVIIAVAVLQIVAAAGSAESAINPTVMSETHVVQWLAQYNPFSNGLY